MLTDLKRCSVCGESKAIDMFRRRSRASDGRQSECKTCAKSRYTENRTAVREQQRSVWANYSAENREKLIEKSRLYRITAAESIRASKSAYEDANRTKIDAKNAVWSQLLTGRMKRQPCEICGDEKADAHHDDYAQPLSVRWLCRTHHAQWHAEHGEAPNGRTHDTIYHAMLTAAPQSE